MAGAWVLSRVMPRLDRWMLDLSGGRFTAAEWLAGLPVAMGNAHPDVAVIMLTGQGSVEAAIRANVHEMILDLPLGYETPVSEGGQGLSGGQRQRIGLARALFGSPKLLVFDEPNAPLDAEGEQALAEALATLREQGSTIILVAHRLGPLSQVDRVIVLNRGQLAMDGPRHEVFQRVRTELVTASPLSPAESRVS